MSTTPQVITLGCRLNSLESEMLKEQAGALDEAVIIVNTCSVTAEAERQARQTIRKLSRQNPDKKIIVTGCAAQVNPSQFETMKEVHKVLGNREKMALMQYINMDGKVAVSPREKLMETARHMISNFEQRTRAFVQIQGGCDHKCSFCIIREARGPSYSLTPKIVLSQIQKLVDMGHQEIVLTGVDISSWGKDFDHDKASLGQLAALILRDIPQLKRLRFSSLDPAVEDDAMIELFQSEQRLMPHIHLSLQAAEDRVLANMGRRHSASSAARWMDRLRDARSDIAFGADMIAGFPKETEAQFKATCDFVQQQQIPLLHVFPYSARTGTPAAKMKAIPSVERKERAKMLRSIGDRIKVQWLKSFIGVTLPVLVEAEGKGYTPHYAPIKLLQKAREGQIVNAIFTSLSDNEQYLHTQIER